MLLGVSLSLTLIHPLTTIIIIENKVWQLFNKHVQQKIKCTIKNPTTACS